MARGWESKSVEDQISEKESQTAKPGQRLNSKQAAEREKRESLLLARTRTMKDLQNARDARYRALLERTLAHLDTQLAELDIAG